MVLKNRKTNLNRYRVAIIAAFLRKKDVIKHSKALPIQDYVDKSCQILESAN